MKRLFLSAMPALLIGLPVSSYALAVDPANNQGSVTFSVKPVGISRSGAPLFSDPASPTNSGALVGPGNGFKDLDAALPPQQTKTGPIANGLSLTADSSLIDSGDFGSGKMTVKAIGFANGGGIFWGPGSVSDKATNNISSVVDSSGSVTLINNSPLSFVGLGGGWLSVRGHLAQAGEYVAASLTGNIGGISIAPIVVAANGPGGAQDGVYTSAGTGLSASSFQSSNGGLDFRAWGVSIIPQRFVIAPGGSITIRGTLTLMADPDSTIELADLPANAPRPDFGVTAVPEPASYALGLVGLMALLVRRPRRAKALKSA